MTKEIFEQNVHDLRKDNRSWRKTYEKLLGKKKLEEEGKKADAIQESSISLQKNNNSINIDENNEDKNEAIKLKMNVDNLKTEN